MNKRFAASASAIILTVLTYFSALAIDDSRSFTFTLSADKTDVRVGDEVTVTLTLSGDGDVLYAAQNEVQYDGERFALVSSAADATNFQATERSVKNGERVVFSFVSPNGEGSLYSETLKVGHFTLRATADGEVTLTNANMKISTRTGADTFKVSGNTITLKVGGTATPEPTQTPQPTPEPTPEHTPEPTAAPTPAPSTAPVSTAARPTPAETATETPEPTQTPTPTPAPTLRPTATPEPTPIISIDDEPVSLSDKPESAEPTGGYVDLILAAATLIALLAARFRRKGRRDYAELFGYAAIFATLTLETFAPIPSGAVCRYTPLAAAGFTAAAANLISKFYITGDNYENS